jgi:superfamily II DNA/RNA helicase
LLDLGFEKELTRISRALKNEKQSVLCSATFPDGVQRLAADFLDPNYYFVSVGVVGSTHSKIRQRFEWMELPPRNVNNSGRNAKNPRAAAVIRNVEQFRDKAGGKKDQSSVIVFSNTKDGVEEYGKALSNKFGGKNVRMIHGDKAQSERNKALGKIFVLFRRDQCDLLSLINSLLCRRLQSWTCFFACGYRCCW